MLCVVWITHNPILVIDAQAPFGRMPLRIQAARVGGVEIPNAKRIEFSLRYVYGIGHTTAKAILADTVGVLTTVTTI